MTRLLRGLSGRKVRLALDRAGSILKRQKGGHMVLRRDEPFAQVVVPTHASIDTGTLAAILHAAGLTQDEFEEWL